MHERTYDIDNFTSREIAESLGYTIPITIDEKKELLGLSKAQRAVWANDRAKAKKKRNAAKRARRASR